MRIGLIDADAVYRGKITYPNLALMKLSAYFKARGDSVIWYPTNVPLLELPYVDICYISRVFSEPYTKDYTGDILAGEVIRAGSGYAIQIENERECYHPELDPVLPPEAEHIYPDYDLYPFTREDGGHAYGFLTRGCPRGCDFCHVAGMQGRRAHIVAHLDEFWHGEKHIVLCDPNILACPEWHQPFGELIDSRAYVDFNQGLDIRLLTDEKIDALNQMKYSKIHFAWDKPQDKLEDQFRMVKDKLKHCHRNCVSVYILTNNGEPFEEDVRRVEFIKSLNMQPYVMVYRQDTAPKEIRHLKRYANNNIICWATPTFNDYEPYQKYRKSKEV